MRSWKEQQAAPPPPVVGDRDDEKQGVVNETPAPKPTAFEAAAGDLDPQPAPKNPYTFKPKPKPKSDSDVVEIPKPEPKPKPKPSVFDVVAALPDLEELNDQAYAMAVVQQERGTVLSASGIAARDELLSPSPDRPSVLAEEDIYNATNPRRSSRLVNKPRPIQLDNEEFPEVAQEQWNKYTSLYEDKVMEFLPNERGKTMIQSLNYFGEDDKYIRRESVFDVRPYARAQSQLSYIPMPVGWQPLSGWRWAGCATMTKRAPTFTSSPSRAFSCSRT